VLPSHSCGGTLQNLDIKLLHSSMQTSADHRSRRRHVSRMTDEKGETWSPSGMSKVRSRPESLVADCSMHAIVAATGKARSPRVPRRVDGTCSAWCHQSEDIDKRRSLLSAAGCQTGTACGACRTCASSYAFSIVTVAISCISSKIK